MQEGVGCSKGGLYGPAGRSNCTPHSSDSSGKCENNFAEEQSQDAIITLRRSRALTSSLDLTSELSPNIVFRIGPHARSLLIIADTFRSGMWSIVSGIMPT